MGYLDIVRAQLVVDEGDRKKPYKDIFGNITIGVGRNLTGVGISQDEEDLMYANDEARADAAARALFPTFDSLTDNRKAALVNMAFNLGQERFAEFHATIAAVTAGDYDAAADDMAASAWAGQVGDRATRLEALMRSG